MNLTPTIRAELLHLAQRLIETGARPTDEALRGYYATFARRFGPERLREVEGRELLELMHEPGNRDSLVYWLEFKDDEEMPARFGSIAGGSALKFGLYRRNETGRWMTGNPSNQREITEDEAIAMATRHRDQLLRGHALLLEMPSSTEDDVYLQLQRGIDAQLPDLANLAWSHKYLSLIHPDRLDDFHNPEYQRYHLMRLLQRPPDAPGRYACAGRYVALARELGLTLNALTSALNHRNGRPRSYWRVGTREGETFRFPEMKDGGWVGVGWGELGDLSEIPDSQAGKEILKDRLTRLYHAPATAVGRQAAQWFRFLHRPQEGDIVVAADGVTVHGVGIITGDYRYERAPGFTHRRSVEWVSLSSWRLATGEGLQTSFSPLRKVDTLLDIEQHLNAAVGEHVGIGGSKGGVKSGAPAPLPPLHGTLAQIHRALDRKGQIILYGPPGTGKTHWAGAAARELVARTRFKSTWDGLDAAERTAIDGDDARLGNIQLCTFHPAYGYEDFIEGYRPSSVGGALVFEPRDGLFKTICADAERRPDEPFYLIIDEINRGDIPRIFGELITLLEKGKRGLSLRLSLTGRPFSVPNNVYIIGTMNTADRSIALLDTALRRRFAFLELMPDAEILGIAAPGGVPLGPWLAALNRRILDHVGRDARNLQIGHAYLMVKGQAITEPSELARALQQDLLPLLEEYCYEDYATLEKILGSGLVDRGAHRIKHALFDPGRGDDLVQALLAMAPDITRTRQALAADEAVAEGSAEDAENDGEAAELGNGR